MAKRATPWKEGKIISIETRKGVFAIAQMLKDPYLRFYNVFRKDEKWTGINLRDYPILFENGVTSQFMKLSNVTVIKDATPDLERASAENWIKGKIGNRRVTTWKGTKDERDFLILGGSPGGSLLYRDITKGGDQDKKVVLEDIPLDADSIIDQHETTGLAVYPATNERLYLCYKAGKNVDPAKDLKFDRELPLEYKLIVDIMAASEKEEQEKILDTYYR